MKKNIFLYLFLIYSSLSSFSQIKALHELGVIVGPVSMQTDFGERHHLPSSVLNIGYGVGIVYYLSANPKRSYWNQRGNPLEDHLKLRFEFSYMQDKLVQRGRYIEGNSAQAILLRGVISDVKLINGGVQMQYSIFSASDNRFLEPYISFGGMYTSYKPHVTSILGDIEADPSLLPNAYHGAVHNAGGTTGSFTLGAGTTYTTESDLKFIMDFRWQRFIKDDIDGLTPLLSANKYNDWLFYLNFGVAFKLN